MNREVTGVLLAGGKSRRMGHDKRFLTVGNRTLFERTLSTLRSVFEEVCVVIAQDSDPLQAEVPVFRDLIPNCGSLGGLHTGLKLAQTPYVFVSACDMPFLNPAAILQMVSLKDNVDVVMVRTEAGLQPTHALYSRRCLPVIEEMLRTRHLKIQDLAEDPAIHVLVVSQKSVRESAPDGRSFLNVNTPEDLEAAERLAGSEDDPSMAS